MNEEKSKIVRDSLKIDKIRDRNEKSFILYRSTQNLKQKILQDFKTYIQDTQVISLLKSVERDYVKDEYGLKHLFAKFESFVKKDMNEKEYLKVLIRAGVELTSKEAPDWEFIASKFLRLSLQKEIDERNNKNETFCFVDKMRHWEQMGLYGSYIRENYSNDEIDELERYPVKERDDLLTYSALDLIVKRYLIKDLHGDILETVQEMFMGIAMHLAIVEKENRIYWAKKFHDILSKLQVTMATPTISNARKPFHQLLSCFVDTVPDSLDGIYRSLDNFAQVSKHGGGMGLYYGIRSVIETGTPFAFNRDTVNRLNPNKHAGMIYSSNLCTEIMQNWIIWINYTKKSIIMQLRQVVSLLWKREVMLVLKKVNGIAVNTLKGVDIVQIIG